jgi:lysophospholipase L1-like esterase
MEEHAEADCECTCLHDKKGFAYAPTDGFFIITVVTSVTCQFAQTASNLGLNGGDRIFALGDSITQAGEYLRLMKKVPDLNYPDLKIEIPNAGISGHKSTDMSARLKKDVIDKQPSIVTISCWVNDVWHGFYDPPRGVDLEAYGSLMRKMVDDLRASTKADIYLLLAPTVIKEDLLSPENAKLEG